MKKSILLMVITAFLFVPPAGADMVTLVGDPWLPYVGEEGSKELGFMIEIATAVFDKAGHEVVFKNVEWDQAIAETREGKFSAICGAYKSDASDFVFPQNEQGTASGNFFVVKDNPWRYTGLESLKGKKIGIITGYSYGEELDAFFKDNPNVVSETKLIKLLELLYEKKIDTVTEDFNVFMLLAMKSYMLEEVVNAGPAEPVTPLYIAFSPNNPKSKEYAEILSAGMDDLRKSGMLKKILENYGLTDWK